MGIPTDKQYPGSAFCRGPFPGAFALSLPSASPAPRKTIDGTKRRPAVAVYCALLRDGFFIFFLFLHILGRVGELVLSQVFEDVRAGQVIPGSSVPRAVPLFSRSWLISQSFLDVMPDERFLVFSIASSELNHRMHGDFR